MNIQGWFHLGLTVLISLLFKGLSWVFSNTTVQSISSLALNFLYSGHRTGKGQFSFQFQRKAIPKNVLEKTLKSPLDCKKIKLVSPKGDQSWIFIGRTNAEAEAPVHRPPDVKSQLIGKDLDAGKDWGQEEKGVTEDEMVGWHHWLNGHEFEQILWDGEGQGSLACCSPWGCEESDTTECLNNKSNLIPFQCCVPRTLQSLSWVQLFETHEL